MKKAYIVHGWGAAPEERWYSWLEEELKTRGIEAVAFEMPDTENPKIETWVKYLEDNIQNPDEETCLIGHSIGCQTILRYLERLSNKTRVGKIILVAPWFSLTGLEEDDLPIAEPWEKTPIDEKKVLEHVGKIIAILSDNDPFVELEKNKNILEKNYKAEITVQPKGGHFSVDTGITELPVVLEMLSN